MTGRTLAYIAVALLILKLPVLLTLLLHSRPREHWFPKVASFQAKLGLFKVLSSMVGSKTLWAVLLPAQHREEWLGDLEELGKELTQRALPVWRVRLRLWFQGVVLVGAALLIHYQEHPGSFWAALLGLVLCQGRVGYTAIAVKQGRLPWTRLLFPSVVLVALVLGCTSRPLVPGPTVL
ncbi:hypothetical protein [Anthocerotibacter panamensis]|uniref:hypothetical protein n=1 Tax=Anthocerotibacter panamensis TaxID=2857077 RepID=UPI001C401B94|nr:hypothetical protein [Anthocerotibacter panamensis]